MKNIVLTLAFTLAAVAAASASRVYKHGASVNPSQTVQSGTVPPPCGLPSLPKCPWDSKTSPSPDPKTVAASHAF